MHTIKLRLQTILSKNTAEHFESVAKQIPEVSSVETWPDRAELFVTRELDFLSLKNHFAQAGFLVEMLNQTMGKTTFHLSGMTCQSCELLIEKKWKCIEGVRDVHANAAQGQVTVEYENVPDTNLLKDAIADFGYAITDSTTQEPEKKVSLYRIAGFFVLALLVLWFLGAVGGGSGLERYGSTIGFFAAITIGLVAGSSSCMAVSGGLLLSLVKKFQEKYATEVRWQKKTPPIVAFVIGRTISYTLLGGVIGILGKALTPAPWFTAAITIFAALIMVVMGIDMLGIAPKWLKQALPRMPKLFGRTILSHENTSSFFSWVTPTLFGAATFFIPCGFTQALQIYALTTGSFLGGALVLGGFALGTAPALIAVGLLSTSLRGKSGRFFLQFSGALVVVLGLWNVQNGLTIAGYPLVLPTFTRTQLVTAQDPNVFFDGKTQVIKMKLGVNPVYSPSDTFTVQAGVPVRMEIQGIGTGCRSIFQIPKFGVSVALAKPVNVVEFTPTSAGQAVFSCSMGMFRGTLNVVQGS